MAQQKSQTIKKRVDMESGSHHPGPLAGYRVLELCSTIAGPACGRIFADFGAEVIKIEPLEGDSVRSLGYHEGDVSLYAASILRNKKSVAIDIKSKQGRDLVLELVKRSDALLENFRPGTLERLGLGYETLSNLNPRLILIRISGYGQDGPYSQKAGYGAICEATAGVREMTGDPDRPPARVALAMTDYMTAVYAALGGVMALLAREKTGKGQIVDAALYESSFSMMESVITAYDRLGIVPTRTGSRLQSTAPNNLYIAGDGAYVLVTANNDKVFARLANAMGRPDLVQDPRFATIRDRATHVDEIDIEVGNWVSSQPARAAQETLDKAGVPVAMVNRISDIFEDPHFRARQMLVQVDHPTLNTLTMLGITPKLSSTPGEIRHAGPQLGADTCTVLRDTLGLSEQDIQTLADSKVLRTA